MRKSLALNLGSPVLFSNTPNKKPMKNKKEYLIHDGARLRQLIEVLIAEHGTQTAAAQAVGVTQGYLNKLKSGAVESLGQHPVAGLFRALGKARAEELRTALVSPAAWRQAGGLSPLARRLAAGLRRGGSGSLGGRDEPGRDPTPAGGDTGASGEPDALPVAARRPIATSSPTFVAG